MSLSPEASYNSLSKITPRRGPRHAGLFFAFKIRKRILNYFKPDNMGIGGPNLIDFYMPFILVIISYIFFSQNEEDGAVDIVLTVGNLDLGLDDAIFKKPQ